MQFPHLLDKRTRICDKFFRMVEELVIDPWPGTPVTLSYNENNTYFRYHIRGIDHDVWKLPRLCYFLFCRQVKKSITNKMFFYNMIVVGLFVGVFRCCMVRYLYAWGNLNYSNFWISVILMPLIVYTSWLNWNSNHRLMFLYK